MTIPDIDFRDINTHSRLPDLTEDKVKTYLSLFNQELRENAKSMYHDQFLQSIRVGYDDEDTYIVGRVSPEMTKKGMYKVHIKIDKFGVVLASQCECGAGEGPEGHCKHVALVLFALTRTKEGIITKETCTQTLMTFHQTKQYKGSPVKMQNLKWRNNTSGQGNFSNLKMFDPRPVNMQKRIEYPQEFRNVWLNSTVGGLPITQLYQPANIKAATHDHMYCDVPMDEQFLREIGVSHCSAEQREDIRRKTCGQAANKAWHEERSLRIHASNFGRICRRTERTDSKQLARQLVNSCHSSVNSEAIKHGRKYESVALKAFTEATGKPVTSSGIHVSATHNFLGCSPDGLVGEDWIVEVKCPYSARNELINVDTIKYLDLQDDKLILNESHEYYYQVQGTLFCTGRQVCSFIVWTFKEMLVINIHRNEAFIEDMLKDLNTFFSEHFRDALLDKRFYRGSDEFY